MDHLCRSRRGMWSLLEHSVSVISVPISGHYTGGCAHEYMYLNCSFERWAHFYSEIVEWEGNMFFSWWNTHSALHMSSLWKSSQFAKCTEFCSDWLHSPPRTSDIVSLQLCCLLSPRRINWKVRRPLYIWHIGAGLQVLYVMTHFRWVSFVNFLWFSVGPMC